MNKSDALAELFVIGNERGLRDPIRRFFLHRLYQDWKLEVFGSCNALAARDDDEVRNMNTMIVQDFFRNAFVLAKRKTRRAATGEGQALHLEKRNDVLIESRIIPELFYEIEKNIRREGLQFLAH